MDALPKTKSTSSRRTRVKTGPGFGDKTSVATESLCFSCKYKCECVQNERKTKISARKCALFSLFFMVIFVLLLVRTSSVGRAGEGAGTGQERKEQGGNATD